jgi:hypothetical protein
MTVSEAVRALEREIDAHVAALPLWRCRRASVVRALLEHYRGATEVAGVGAAFAAQAGHDPMIPLQMHQRWQAGVFWALKWAMTLCPEESTEQFTDEMILGAQTLGEHYEVLVDALWMAKTGRIEIMVDAESHTVTMYEGGEVTGSDWSIVHFQQRDNLIRAHVVLTDDSDQLTTRWSAGAYRRTAAWIAGVADAACDTVMYAPPGVEPIPLFKQPTIVALPEPPDAEMRAVIADLAMSPEELARDGLYKYVSWRDSPLVAIEGETLGVSDILIAMAGRAGGDHTLRLASRADQAQYSTVSGLREQRMMDFCRRQLEQAGWTVRTRYRLTDPPQEIDVYGEQGNERLTLSLKSTVRPETPRETYSRNEDILDGIDQAARSRQRLGVGTTSVVITDGYRGDYSTWRAALDRDVGVGTLDDVADVARTPADAMTLLRERAGFAEAPRDDDDEHERRFELFGWTFRILDAPPPGVSS